MKKKSKEVCEAKWVGPPRSISECEAIARSEFAYWQKHNQSLGSIGALGAAVNIYCALRGWRAPWHPKVKKKGKK